MAGHTQQVQESQPTSRNASSKVSPELLALIAKSHGMQASARTGVIVQFRQPVTNGHVQKVTKLGGVRQRSFQAIHGGVFSLPRNQVSYPLASATQ